MKHTTNRILATILVFVIFASQSIMAFSGGSESGPASGYCGESLTWSYNRFTLVISGSGEMYDYDSEDSELSQPWLGYEVHYVIIDSGVTSICNRAFALCDDIESFTVDENNEYYSSDSNGALYNKDKTKIIQYPSCNKATSFSIPKTAFTIPDSVIIVGAYAFEWCRNLVEITISDNVKVIDEYAFDNCDKLESIIIPDSVNIIGDFAFRFCTKLNSVTLGNGVNSIGNGAFYSCYNLETITLPTSITSIGEKTFYYCEKMKNIIIPNGVTEIGEGAFNYCKSLSSIEIPNSVTKLEENVFSSCENLISVTLPVSLTYIPNGTFRYCDNLVDVYYNGTEKQWGLVSIDSNNDGLLNATIHFNSVSQPEVIAIGDISSDGKINSNDALLILQAATGKLTLTEAQLKSADVNCDGEISSADALRVLQFSTGLITEFK